MDPAAFFRWDDTGKISAQNRNVVVLKSRRLGKEVILGALEGRSIIFFLQIPCLLIQQR